MMIQYLIESACCLAALYALYYIALRRETFFQWNRLYLVLTPVLAFTLPALNIRLEKSVDAVQTPTTTTPVVWVERAAAVPQALETSLEQPVANVSLGAVLWWLYLGIAGVLALRLLWQCLRLLLFIRRTHRRRSG
jgi:hypothetical protein